MNTTFVLFAISLLPCCAEQVDGQQQEKIVIVDQDGEKVEAEEFKQGAKVEQENEPVPPAAGGDPPINDKDSVLIIDKDGKQRRVDASDVKAIAEARATARIIGRSSKVRVKAIVIGPDGQPQEFDLPADNERLKDLRGQMREFRARGVFDMLPGLEFDLEQRHGGAVFSGPNRGSKYKVGVTCEPVGDQLRAHLSLADGQGLVVTYVDGDSEAPANSAGVKLHDILIYADQETLESVDDLVAAVQLAGKEGRSLDMTVLRGGKELVFEIKPVERNAEQLQPGDQLDFGPGVVIEGDVFDRLKNLGGNDKRAREKERADLQQLILDKIEEKRRQLEGGGGNGAELKQRIKEKAEKKRQRGGDDARVDRQRMIREKIQERLEQRSRGDDG